VKVIDKRQKDVKQLRGGELVVLKITTKVIEDICQPIIGFSLKDRLGQVLFGENTYATYADKEVDVSRNDLLVAEFEFAMPILPPGDYSISVAIATGTQQDHEQQHWIHDALIIKSITSSVSTGLVGIPMRKIKLKLEK